MNKRRVRLFARLGLYVVAACFAYMAMWIAWMIGEQVTTARGSIHVMIALVIAMLVGAPAGYAMAMTMGAGSSVRKEKDT